MYGFKQWFQACGDRKQHVGFDNAHTDSKRTHLALMQWHSGAIAPHLFDALSSGSAADSQVHANGCCVFHTHTGISCTRQKRPACKCMLLYAWSDQHYIVCGDKASLGGVVAERQALPMRCNMGHKRRPDLCLQ